MAAWLGAAVPHGPLLHAECGDGSFALELAAELGGAVACPGLRAAGRRHSGRPGPGWRSTWARPASCWNPCRSARSAPWCSRAWSTGSRLAEQLGLLATAGDRLVDGGALVVIGTRPEAAAAAWGPVTADLLPGRPLHPETWELLLERSGYDGVCRIGGGEGDAMPTHAVGGRRPA